MVSGPPLALAPGSQWRVGVGAAAVRVPWGWRNCFFGPFTGQPAKPQVLAWEPGSFSPWGGRQEEVVGQARSS